MLLNWTSKSNIEPIIGWIPLFADLETDTYGIDPKSIEKLISPRTKAIMVVHIFGYPSNMDAIMKIANKYNLKVIEDAAQAPGVYYKGKAVGTIGDIGGFSLNFHKHIHTGEGGLLVTNNDDIALRSQLIRNHGENAIEAYGVEDISNTIGGNYRYTELQAAIAIEQFKKLHSMLDHRKKVGSYRSDRLRNIDGLNIQEIEKGCNHSYYMYPIRFEKDVSGISRNLFLR